MPNALQIEPGAKFGRLTVLFEADRRRLSKRETVRCFQLRCECGNETVAILRNLRSGVVRSCGCIRVERIAKLGCEKKIHGEATYRTPEYNSWRSMRDRCLNPNNARFSDYGGRGVTVCDRWVGDFSAFLADIGRKPSPAHSLDRIDANGNYEPGNCRWATPKEQANNRRPRRIRMEA